ncbi:MAG: hypothetical protein U0R81_09035 [Mycobacterium sp.]
MTAAPGFERLAQNWIYWSALAHLGAPAVTTGCDDCEVLFASTEYSVHLRHDDGWWSVDTVDERHQRQNDTARFSEFDLAEKYLVWIWGSTARSVVRAPILGQRLYALGFAPDVVSTAVSAGIYELRSPAGFAVLTEPYATIFSHLMDRSESEIEDMLRAGIDR